MIGCWGANRSVPIIKCHQSPNSQARLNALAAQNEALRREKKEITEQLNHDLAEVKTTLSVTLLKLRDTEALFARTKESEESAARQHAAAESARAALAQRVADLEAQHVHDETRIASLEAERADRDTVVAQLRDEPERLMRAHGARELEFAEQAKRMEEQAKHLEELSKSKDNLEASSVRGGRGVTSGGTGGKLVRVWLLALPRLPG